ncbi:MAG: flavin reductase family protein [Actinomycetota bacterium]
MELEGGLFYRAMAPRLTVLVSTVDAKGNSNAAPFSFVMPVSAHPPLVAIASAHTRHTLENIRETKQFVLNVPSAEIVDPLWECSKSLPKGVSEIKVSGLTEEPSKVVKPPRIAECISWFECELVWEKEAGDHVVIVGRVVKADVRDRLFSEGRFDFAEARTLMHVTGKKFAVAEREVNAR